MRDLYQALGVPQDAPIEVIRSAYRREALYAHPDRGGNAERMALINEAYETLADPARRRNFDARRSAAQALDADEEETVVIDHVLEAGEIVPYSQAFKKQHQTLVKKYEHSPLTPRTISDSLQPFESNLYSIKKQSGETTYFHDIFSYIHASVETPHQDRPLPPLEGSVSPILAIKLFKAFLSGRFSLTQLQPIVQALSLTINTIKTINANTRELSLYEGIIEILLMTHKAPEHRHELIFSIKKITDFAKETSDNNLSELIPLFYNRFFRNLYAYAFHLYYIFPKNPLDASEVKHFNGVEEAKELLNTLIERLRSGSEQEHLIEQTQYVKLLYRLEKDLDHTNTPEQTAEKNRETAFHLLDWIPAIIQRTNKPILVNLFLQIGICFQKASQEETRLAIKMADEQLALQMYRTAMGCSTHTTPDVEIYVNTQTLRYVTHFQFQDAFLSQFIPAVQRQTLTIVDIFPFFKAPQSNIAFFKQENASLHLMRHLLQSMVVTFEHSQMLSEPFPIDHSVSNMLYQAYEACLKNWYQETYNPETENKLRLQLMESLLLEKKWTFLDVEQNLDSPWIMVDRDEEGWLAASARTLPFGDDEGIVKYREVHGAEVNYKTGEVTFFLEAWDKKYGNNDKLFTLYDVQEMLEKDLHSAIFSLDPIDPDKPYHPFQTMYFQPTQLCETELLNTMLLTDYILKFLTTNQEVQGQYPFEQRPVKKMIQHVPEYLRQIITNFHKSQRTDGATHRFWIEAEEVDVSLSDELLKNEGVSRIKLDNLKMVVKKHRMERDINGELKDTEKESEGWPIYVLTREQWQAVQQGHQMIDGHAMIFIYKEFKLFYWENNKTLCEHVPENVRQLLVRLYTHPREENGKITPNPKNSTLLYRATKQMAEQSNQSHRYSPEFIFAQEFSIHYDEFALYFPEFARLKELSKLTTLIRFLNNMRTGNKKEMEALDFLLEDTPKPEGLDTDVCDNYTQAQEQLYSQINSSFQQLRIQLRGMGAHEKERAHENIHEQFPNSSLNDIAAALDGKETALKQITKGVWRTQLREQRTHKDKVELAFANIGLGKQSEPVSLEGRCFWVPASVRHEVPQEPSGLTRHSFFTYGGVSIHPRVNIASRNAGPLRGNTVGGAQIIKNKIQGDLFRDQLAQQLRAAGREVHIEVSKRTPFGRRFMDIEIRQNGVPVGGIETKTGKSRYTPSQRAKDEWLKMNGYPVNLARQRK